MEQNILDAEPNFNLADARKQGLPKWFKGVSWFFVVLSCYNCFAFLINIASLSFQIPFITIFFSIAALAYSHLFMVGIYLLIAIVGIGLLSGKLWAIDAGFVLAGLQGLIMLADFVVSLSTVGFHFPISLGLAVVFYLCLFNFKDAWKNPQKTIPFE
ncbi:hypothetical protein BH09BAC1_BH09BAC1_05260 [soil metagenome]